MYKRIVITGGAGFVGSNLGTFLKRDFPSIEVIAVDNLYRRGSELALPRLKKAGVQFVHGDIRCKEDLSSIGLFDLMIECSAEPSARAGYDGDPSYLLHTNLLGTINCLEAVRKVKADLLFLSTSRVYSLAHLQRLPLQTENKRLVLRGENIGYSPSGISAQFSLQGPRSLYGATKLASELLIEEYHHMYGLKAVINRSGVLAGPWQMGRVDQGFVTLWLARHLFGGGLKYIGYGGRGYQVRDILHIEDLYDLLVIQMKDLNSYAGKIYNVGGGLENSTSLAELTEWCGQKIASKVIESDATTHPSDIPYYVTDNTEINQATNWLPKRSVSKTFEDILTWLNESRNEVEPILK